METSKKVAGIIALIPVIILIILENIRAYSCIEQIKLYVVLLFLLLAVIPPLFSFIATFPLKFKKIKWWPAFSKAFSDLLFIYYGFLVIGLSLNTDIIPKMGRWDISMFSLGITFIFFGITYLTHQKQEPLLEKITGKIDRIEEMVGKLQPPKTRSKTPKK
jgi:hypothetical protein